MAENNSTTRRTILKVSGAVGATAFLAGCADDNGNDDENDDDDPAPDENDNDEADVEDWEDVDEIMLDGITSGWVGMEPDVIADEENPTLVLFEGESYDITWENGDGAQHNIEIVDEDDEVVDDLETDNMDEEGETQTLEVDEVTDEMAEYVCRPHETQMRGEIDVQELSLIHISSDSLLQSPTTSEETNRAVRSYEMDSMTRSSTTIAIENRSSDSSVVKNHAG